MTTRMFHTAALLLAVALTVQSGYAGDKAPEGKKKGAGPNHKAQDDLGPLGGPLDQIKRHADELKLTDEQKKKLEELKKEYAAKFEKIKEDPNLKDLHEKLMQARKDKDEEATKSLQKQIREEVGKKSGVTPKDVIVELGKILDKDQLAKLAEFRKKDGGPKHGDKDNKDDKKDESRRPNPDKGAPSIYDEK